MSASPTETTIETRQSHGVVVDIIRLVWPDGGVLYDLAVNGETITDDESLDHIPDDDELSEIVGEFLGRNYLARMTAPIVLSETDQERIASLLSDDERDHLETLPGEPGYDTTYGDKVDQADAEAAVDEDEDEDEDDKGEMVFVYQSDLVALFDWLNRIGVDMSTMTEREAEAWESLDADAGA